ncbi:MAG: TIGR03790 family protein [Gammaproteobacteria bacterium]
MGRSISVWVRASLAGLLASLNAGTAYAALGPQDVALVINEADPHSISTGELYAAARAIPEDAVIRVRFEPVKGRITPKTFARIKAEVDRKTPRRIQAYALAWTRPWRVGCMSVTSAFALGFDKRYCARGCKATAPNPYFNTLSDKPFRDFGVRPSILIAGRTQDDVRGLIERGVAADRTRPRASAYLMSTSDAARNTRAAEYESYRNQFTGHLDVKVVEADKLEDRTDVLFYFTGLVRVEAIESNRFVPGAIADHLTSSGGRLVGAQQMSALAWLEAGATGSYGSVVEPCSFPQKFPHPAVVMAHYLNGDTLIEAYWKSVAWPGQGLFIGEPLAAPFRR